MKRFIPRPSRSSIRVFNACLLSFLLLMTPLATLAASMRPAAPRALDSAATKPRPADAAKPQPATTESETKAEDLQHASSTNLFNLLAQPLPPAITATKVDAFTDADGDGKADIGQTINYTSVISNITGTSSATSVVFTDTPDANTTLTGTVNTSPIALDQAVTLNEDTPTAITLTGIDPDNNSLTYTVVGNPTNGGLTGTAPNLTYTPNANFFGSDTFTFKVNDGTVDSNQLGTISITINSVNDPPTFTQSGGNQTVFEDSGAQSVPGFITAISPGPANESAQTVSFVITNNSNPGIFAGGGAPAISPTGTLTYTPALNENGTATITYKAQDNGGTANGGDDDSPTQSFTITINAVNDPPVAVAKAFTAQANMKINLTGLLTGATDPNDTIGDQDAGYVPTFSLTSISAAATPCSSPACTAAQIAAIGITNLSNTNNGSFDFNPPPGYTGTVNLTYIITDNGNPAPGVQSAPQTITITVQGPVVWFVDPNAASNGDGRLGSPFKFLSNNAGANNDADDVDAAGHRIFIYNGGPAAVGGFTLNANEYLVGQGASGSFDTLLLGLTPPTGTFPRPALGGARPTITSASSGVTLGSGNQLYALSFQDTAGTAINGSGINVGTLLMSDIDIVNDISASGAGIFLSGGGTVTLTGTNNFITTTSATALFVANTTIGAANLNFVTIKAGNNNAFPDPTEGINLNNTGASGGLIVTGNSAGQCGGNVNTGTDPFSIAAPVTADCTGGEIQGTTGNGITLTNTRNVSLTRMWIHNTTLSGIDGTTVTNFTFDRGLIEKSGLNDALNPVTASSDISNIAFNDVSSGVNNLSGTVSITRSTLRNAWYHGIDILNESGTISDLTIGGSSAGNAINSTSTTASSKGVGIRVRMNGAAASAGVVTKATVTHNSVQNFPSDSGIKVLGGNAVFGPQAGLGVPGSATNTFAITNNAVGGFSAAAPMGSNGIETAMTGTGQAKFVITNNGTATTPIRHFLGIGITSSGGNRASVVSIITNNVIDGASNIASSSGMAVGAQVGYPGDTTSNGTFSASISSNTINNSHGPGIRAGLTNSNISGNLNIKSNTVGAPRDTSGAGYSGIRVDSGTSSGDTNLCLDLASNNSTGNVSAGGFGTNPGIALRKQGSVATTNDFGIVGLSPSPATAAQTETYVSGQNPGSNLGDPVNYSHTGSAVRAFVISGSNFVSCSSFTVSSIENQSQGRDLLARMESVFQNNALDSLFVNAKTGSDYASISDELNGVRQAAPAESAVNDSRAAQVTAKAESTVENNASMKLASLVQTSALVNMFGAQSNVASVKQTAHATNTEARVWSDIAPASGRASRATTQAQALSAGNNDSALYKASFVKASYEPSAAKTGDAVRATESNKYTDLSHARTTRIKQPAHKATAASSAFAPMPAVGTVRVDGSGNGSGTGFTLPAGKSVTVTFSVTVNSGLAAGVTQVSNQGQVAGSGFGPVLTDDTAVGGSADPTVTPIARADLALTSKTDGVTTINPGQDLTYTIAYANHGRAASNAVITETVPTGTVFKSAGSSAGWSCPNGSAAGTTCTLTLGAVPSTGIGSTGSKTFVVTVINPAAAGLGSISNTASIADTVVYEPDITPADNSATDNNTVLNAAPDLTVSSKSDGVTNTTPGSTLTYTINYANTGNQGAANVVLTETVPTGTTYVAAGSSAWSCANGSVGGTTCTITVGSLAGGGANGTATFIVTVNSPATAGLNSIVNTASIADDGANGADATPANNSKTDTDILDAAPDLTLTKTPDVSTIAPGQPIIYTLNYANVGNQGATTVVITETVPANTTFATVGSTAGWSCANGSPAGTSCTLAIGTVGAGTNGSATFAVTVVDPVPGGTTQITNVATIADDGANGSDPTPANNSTGNVTIGVCLNPATVTNSNDSGAGSLRQALIDVCDGGTINFQAGVSTNLTSGELVVDKSVTINGNGASLTTVQRTSGTFRIFNINPGKVVNISGMTISNGQAPNGADNGAGSGAPGEAGGGIFNEGTLTLSSVVVSGNHSGNGGSGTGASGGPGGLGGGIANGPGATLNINSSTISGNQSGTGGTGTPAGFGGNGGGIYSLGNLTINNSTLSGNQALGLGAEGGGIDSEGGTLIINNSTISGNTADGPGGGLLNCGSSTATLTNVTITNNRADNDNDALGAGGGIGQVSSNPITLHNTIVAGNFLGGSPSTTPDDIDGTVDAASSYNLIGVGGSGGLTSANNNQVNVADALLGPLANNGGPTQTHALLVGSPALDAGDNSVTGAPLNFTTDQRGSGFPRNLDAADANTTDTVDIGAFEANPMIQDIADQSTNEDVSVTCVPFNIGDADEGFSSIVATSSDQVVVPDANLSVNAGTGPSDRCLAITLPANQSGTTTITVTVTGNNTRTISDTFVLTVNAVNDPPDAVDDSATVDEDSVNNSIDVLFNDTFAPDTGETLTITGKTDGANGTVAITGGGTGLTYTPNADYFGSDSFTYTISDGNGGTDTATVNVTVTGINDVPSFTKGADEVVNEDAGAQTVNPWTSTFSAGPNEGAQTVNFIVSNDNNALFSVQPVISATGVLTYTPAANANGLATVTVQIHDNGGTAGGGVDTSASQTFTITVTAVNDVPSFAKGSDETVNEDAGAQTVNPWATALSAGPADEAGQTLSFTVNNNNNALFSVQPAVDSSGVLTYTPAPNANGTAIVSVSIVDNGGTANGGVDTSAIQTFNINVTAVNDAPSFTKGPDQVAGGAFPQTALNWATNILAGPPDESTQTVDFIVSNNNNALFTTQPAVDPSGTLTYTPALGANGTATVSVQIHDNGGTANGGVNTSAIQTFVITVNPIGWTTTADSGVTEDESNPEKPAYTNFTANLNAGSAAGEYVLRYNVTAIGNLTSVGASNTRLRVRFRDEGAGSRVRVSIMRSPITGGASTLGTVFDSDTFSADANYQTQEVLMPAITFDFTQYVYWLEVTMTKDTTANTPGFGLAQINQQ